MSFRCSKCGCTNFKTSFKGIVLIDKDLDFIKIVKTVSIDTDNLECDNCGSIGSQEYIDDDEIDEKGIDIKGVHDVK